MRRHRGAGNGGGPRGQGAILSRYAVLVLTESPKDTKEVYKDLLLIFVYGFPSNEDMRTD
jgi:hypothetical protein